MNKTYTELVTIASSAARAAGSIVRDGFGKTHKIQFKGAINLVTEVDHAAEALILEQLRMATPTFDILTEESGAHTAEHGSGGSYRWVIDPIDGTTNFAHHFPYLNVSIGLEENGASVVGVVYDPLLDQLFTATRGGGAFLNGATIQCSKAEKVRESLVASGLVYDIGDSDRGIPEIVRLIKQSRAVRINGSAALDICYVACGRLDAYCDTGLSPWDIAAARVIVQEAGGVFQLYGDAADVDGQYCIVSNGKIHAELERLLMERE
jgi:myo-inositol-1(or 4)-monophosphatase